MSSERSRDTLIWGIDAFLQSMIGERETRPDPGELATAHVFRDFSAMTEIDACMSNCFGDIDEGMDEQLRARPGAVYSRHAGWNFNGKVWFENGLFHEEVWVYHVPRQTFSAPTLRELMDAVNAEYGSE